MLGLKIMMYQLAYLLSEIRIHFTFLLQIINTLSFDMQRVGNLFKYELKDRFTSLIIRDLSCND